MSEDVVAAHERTLQEVESVLDEFRTGSIAAAVEQLETMRNDRAERVHEAATDEDAEDDED